MSEAVTARRPRNIVIASSRADADQASKQKGLDPKFVEWFTKPEHISPGHLDKVRVFFSPAYTHRSDYAEARAVVKALTAKN